MPPTSEECEGDSQMEPGRGTVGGRGSEEETSQHSQNSL